MQAELAAKESARIAVIGAGPAGLTIARLLKDLGVVNVAVFDAPDWPGGKGLPIERGDGLYELGTCYTTFDHFLVNRWMRELGIKQVPLGRQMLDGAPFLHYVSTASGPPLAVEMARFLRLS